MKTINMKNVEATTRGKLHNCTYRIEWDDHYYSVKYVYSGSGAGWYVDGAYITPMVDGLGTKMYEMAINVLQIWMKARKQAGV